MITQQAPPLAPLRISAGWEVYHNVFAEAEQLVEDGTFVNSYLFIEDLLYLRSLDLGGITRQQQDINLGWYPDEDINGRFRLELLIGASDEPVKIYRSRDY